MLMNGDAGVYNIPYRLDRRSADASVKDNDLHTRFEQ
jgi:hypothetical protein